MVGMGRTVSDLIVAVAVVEMSHNMTYLVADTAHNFDENRAHFVAVVVHDDAVVVVADGSVASYPRSRL